MGKRNPIQVLRDEGPVAFAFLVEFYGFLGPELLGDGFRYHRPDLRVDVCSWEWKGERGFTTAVVVPDGSDFPLSADLGCLYVACELGPLQSVGGSTGSRHVLRKRIAEHSAALRKVMPRLDGPECHVLLRRCHGRLLPG